MIRLLYDTESNGFLKTATKIHCIGIIDTATGERTGYGPDQIGEAVRRLEQADVRIGHNIQRHDEPLLRKLRPPMPR